MPDPFSLDSLQKAVQAALEVPSTPIPPGHTLALVSVIDGDRAQLTVAKKINDKWQVEGYVTHPWEGPAVQGGVMFHGSW